MLGVVAVSYTHLDVYKRQKWYKGLAKEHPEFFAAKTPATV